MKYQIAEARKLRNITQAELAEKMRTTQQTIQRYETNQVNIRMDKMIEMSEILNVSLAYLLGMSSKPELSEASDMVPVPLLDSIAAGTSIEMIDVDKTYDIPAEIHNKYPQAFLLKVADDSMNRVLPNGCYALINPCREATEPMKAYAVCVNGFNATIQRVKTLSNGYELIPDSIDPTFRSQIFDFNEIGTQSVSIIGEVVWYLVPFGFEI
ncbi:XRE family transcriptional regulator [Lancefieldella parvula]|uniref:LexA family protein n=1 Tax=Lancefieldella parvula TaxID=1382 RepID=UPI0028D35806|nr:XRE family transcriptional regulator [Lancefieldella parvula]